MISLCCHAKGGKAGVGQVCSVYNEEGSSGLCLQRWLQKKVKGPFKRTSPYWDKMGIWRVGSRMRDFRPFTEDNRPAILLPRNSHYMELLVGKAYRKR